MRKMHFLFCFADERDAVKRAFFHFGFTFHVEIPES
jgi:hypothetical protein